jgi:CHAT domain-containing protein
LRKHLSLTAALQKAQQQMRSEQRWSDPYYWAAFTLQGDWQ